MQGDDSKYIDIDMFDTMMTGLEPMEISHAGGEMQAVVDSIIELVK
jgi:hypothetical protein